MIRDRDGTCGPSFYITPCPSKRYGDESGGGILVPCVITGAREGERAGRCGEITVAERVVWLPITIGREVEVCPGGCVVAES